MPLFLTKFFINIAKKISGLLHYKVVLSVDCLDVNEKVYVFGTNCRISGQYLLSHLTGINLPARIIA